jgi:serine/threonine-protein kinase
MADASTRLAEALADRYRIKRPLGTGGMASVYLADDLKHHREVAIKVLHPELAMGVGAERFVREIRMVARLTHPHILPLFDSGEAGGFLYFVMPSMEGASLREKLERTRPLPVEEAAQIAREVADALDYAHRQGVVHRDIKPENVMLHGGHAVVADFGIGLVIAQASDSAAMTQTGTGMSIGTPAYMSPEQAAGEERIDGRSDLYSLGCLLYEALTGEPPFTGPTLQSVMTRRLTQTPPPVTSVRPSVNAGISRTVSKLLATRPDDRYATAAHFIEALAAAAAAVRGAAVPNGEQSIAVLPFKSLSADPNDEFFADGVTEEILNALAQIQGLRVAGRSSAFSFKGRSEDLRSIGAKLNVSSILEGTLRRAGNRLRITAQLTDAGTGFQLWSEKFDRVVEDVFAVQDEIAATIAGRLKLSLASSKSGPAAQPPTRHLGAYELYLKGRALLYQRGLSIAKAIDCFREAVTLDPEYAHAWAGLADGYSTSAYSGFARADELMPRARDAAQRALALGPDLAEAHNALAMPLLMYARDYQQAEREFRRATELNPSYPQARAWYGLFCLQWIFNRGEDARVQLDRLLEIDPLSGYANIIASFSACSAGRIAEGIEHAERGIALDPNSYLGHWAATIAYHVAGRNEEAALAGQRALAMSGRHSWTLSTLVSIYAALGRPDDARALYREAEDRAQREYIQPSLLAGAAAAIGDRDQAIVIARRALDERDPLFVIIVRTWPTYDLLRDDPRFHDIVAELRLPGWHPGERPR